MTKSLIYSLSVVGPTTPTQEIQAVVTSTTARVMETLAMGLATKILEQTRGLLRRLRSTPILRKIPRWATRQTIPTAKTASNAEVVEGLTRALQKERDMNLMTWLSTIKSMIDKVEADTPELTADVGAISTLLNNHITRLQTPPTTQTVPTPTTPTTSPSTAPSS